MLKLLINILNYIIIGNDTWTKFIGTHSFEDAFEMLKKGYFIYTSIQKTKVYGMIGGVIYEFNIAKDIVTKVDGFNKEAMMYRSWEILPSLEQAHFTGEIDD